MYIKVSCVHLYGWFYVIRVYNVRILNFILAKYEIYIKVPLQTTITVWRVLKQI